MESLMLIDASHPEETRVVITANGAVQDYDFSLASKKQIKGNIYLAKVTRVEPSLQAAFVEYGGNRQGFLPFSEIHPDYYQIPTADKEALLRQEEEELSDEQEKSEEPAPAAPAGDEQEVISEPQSAVIEEEKPETEADLNISSSETREDELELAGAENTDLQPVLSEGNTEITEPKQDVEQVGGGLDEEISSSRPAKKFRFQKRYKIQEVIKKGQVILVQVIKEERGNKGAAMSTYISLPGRYCVLMPNTMRAVGISRRISDPRDRSRLKSVTDGLDVPKGMSVIIRTAGIDRSKPEIKRDYEYLLKLWNTIRENTLSSYAPSMIYEEGDLIKRSLRDLYTPNIDEILIQGEEAFKVSKEMMKALMPSHAAKVKHYAESVPLFYRYDIEDQLRSIHEPNVKLRSGGYIVFGSTEALVAIDVNSGRSTSDRHIEETATRTNLEAAVEIARQIKLRDLAGLVVIDFIDMMDGKNRRAVEKALKEALKSDRAKIQVGRISTFGLLEMTRQRLRPSITESIMELCPKCSGHGMVKNTETLALDIIRELEIAADGEVVREIKVETRSECALYLLNNKRHNISHIENKTGVKIDISITEGDVAGGFRITPQYLPNAKPQSKHKAGKPHRHDRKHAAEPPKAVSFEPEYSESLPEEETSGEAEHTQEENPRNKNQHGRRKKIPGKGGHKAERREHKSHNTADTDAPENNETAIPLSEEEGTGESVAGEGHERKGRNRNRKDWKKHDRKKEHPQPEKSASTDSEPSKKDPKAEADASSVSEQKPRQRASKIEKISEFKVREKKKTESAAEEESPPQDNNPGGPKRSGWWGKLIKNP